MNLQIVRNTLEDQFLTAFLGILDLETLRLKFVNASHTCPILYGPKRFALLDTEGLCCGMFEEPRYEEKEIQLQAGDRILFYTRGLVRMCNPRNHAYADRRLHKLLRANRDLEIGAMVERVGEDFSRHLAGAEQVEDLTLVGLEVVPREAKEERVVIPSEPMQLARVESLILSRLEALNYGERALFAVRLALEEAVINAIKHGNRMDKAKHVTVTFSVDRDECVVTVEDEGSGFDPGAVPDPTADENLELPHGRGLVLMRAYMDDVSFNAKGNRVTMRKKAPWTQ
jgi:serine/threonine-protein kinase RsbW